MESSSVEQNVTENAAPTAAEVSDDVTVAVTPIRVTRQRLETIGRQAAANTPDSRPGYLRFVTYSNKICLGCYFLF
jgi:hypothetical protein